MSKLRDYQSWKLKKLSNPQFAAHYLNEIEKSSPELVLSAIQNVVRAREVTTVAKEAGVARENIYRAFSEQGNPTVTTFREVLRAVGVKFNFKAIEAVSPTPAVPVPPSGLTPASPGVGQQEDNALANSGETSRTGLCIAYINPIQPCLRGIGQQRKAVLRSAYGRDQTACYSSATS